MNEILLFISKSSIYYQATMDEFQKLLKELEGSQQFISKIIDVNEDPDMAEKHKVDALPTLIIGNKRFIGQLNVGKIVKVLKNKS